MAVAAPVLAPYDPLKSDFRAMTKPPTERHVFGTDQIGRDVLTLRQQMESLTDEMRRLQKELANDAARRSGK